MAIINPNWKTKRLEEISDYKAEKLDKIDVIIDYNPATKWLIAELSRKDIPFKVLNLGSGVKRITTDVRICPKCNGLGKC